MDLRRIPHDRGIVGEIALELVDARTKRLMPTSRKRTDCIAARQELPGDRAAEKPAAAGDENAHHPAD